MGKTLPFVNTNTTIKVFRQALALDEVCDDHLIHRFLSWARYALRPVMSQDGHVPTILLPHILSPHYPQAYFSLGSIAPNSAQTFTTARLPQLNPFMKEMRCS